MSQLVEGLRTGRITSRQAAEQLEAYRDSRESPPPGTSSETVRIQDAADGRLWFERDTPENDEDRPGERTAVGESEAISRRQRQLIMMVRSVGSGIPSTEKFVNNVQQGLTAYVSADPQQRTSGTQETNPPANPPSADFDAGDAMSATLTAIVATVVLGQRAAEKLHSPRKPKPRASRAPGSDRGGNVPENGTGRPRLRWFVRRAPRAAKLSARSE